MNFFYNPLISRSHFIKNYELSYQYKVANIKMMNSKHHRVFKQSVIFAQEVIRFVKKQKCFR